MPVLGVPPGVAGTIVPNRALPRKAEAPSGWQLFWLVKKSHGTAAALRRMKIVKFSIREEIWLASSPAVLPVGMMTWALSSGVGLVAHPPLVRSLVNSWWGIPISRLEASPENISMDLFCAFQPNLVMVPSLPLVLNRPAMPAALLTACRKLRLLLKASSVVFSTKPSPKVGIG